MSRRPTPQIFLQLPDVAGRDTLRAALMALQCVPTNLPEQSKQLDALLQRVVNDERVFLFIDVSNGAGSNATALADVANRLPTGLKARTILTRLAAGHVSEADRAWVKALGFIDLLPELDRDDPYGGLGVALDQVAMQLNLTPLAPADLARYVRAVAVPAGQDSPRRLIRRHTGLAAELLAALLSEGLAIEDRAYHLKKYPRCFVGAEAVRWLAKRFKLLPDAAVAVGQALGTLGLLHHVEHKHHFSDGPLFFRLALSPSADKVSLGAALGTLHAGLAIADRSYLGTVYPRCWTGTQAVDVIGAQHALSRVDAHLVMLRLMQFGLFDHVVSEQPFIDGNFFYRLKSGQPATADFSALRGQA